jgi:hypothetical protein
VHGSCRRAGGPRGQAGTPRRLSEVFVLGKVRRGFHEREARVVAASAAGREPFPANAGDFMFGRVDLKMLDTVEPRNRDSLSRFVNVTNLQEH